MKHLCKAFLLLLPFFTTPLFAGSGHDHGHSHGPISADAVTIRASNKVQQLVKAGKIEVSWSKINATGVEQKSYAKGPEWVVTFNNEAVKDVAKKTLYLFYSLDGHYIAANFSGN